MRLAIFGDSFGYVRPLDSFPSWASRLQNLHDVKNYCQCGVSQYRIMQQIKSTDLSKFDKIIITHTSPTRVFVRNNPIHINSETHQNCDLLLADIEQRKDKFSQAALNYFKYIFDMKYALDIHNLICKEIDELVATYDPIHITHFDYHRCYEFKNMINFHDLWLKNRGPVSHYNEQGNNKIFSILSQKL